jgi:hypothetical protein
MTKRVRGLLILIVAGLAMRGQALGQCPVSSKEIDKNLPKLKINPIKVGDGIVHGTLDGTLPSGTVGKVQACIDSAPQGGPNAVEVDGSFVVRPTSVLAARQTISFQLIATASGGAATTGPSVNVAVSDTGNSGTVVVAIAGVEQSGYSSLGLNTSPFLNLFIQGPVNGAHSWKSFGGWGRTRLLGAPQPSTQGIVSTFTDPTGQLTTQDYSKVGTAVDFMIGPTYRIADADDPKSNYGGWELIAGIGATTPLSSQTVALTYKAPPLGSIECATLTNRFTIQKGYAPGLTQAPAGSATCLAGGYTDISFSNQDRSSFLLKWGAGVRTTAKFPCEGSTSCAPSYGALDITIGQDASVTRGLMQHFVFKLDGILPISIKKNSSFLYLFGSAYIRKSRNEDLAPLILQTETATVTIPSSTVIVLPLQQPDRDFFRLGVGLNLNQVFCKMFNSCTAP